MYNGKRISLVIPCYNEEQGLEEVLKNKPAFLDEVIVIDNNSSDRTPEVAKKYGAIVIDLRCRGYGLAYQVGLPKASGDIIVMMDGDNNHPISEVENLLTFMEDGNYDFISGCRFPLKDKKNMSNINKIANYFISWLIRRGLHINLADSQSGMCVLKRNLVPEILSLDCDMSFSQEVKIKAWLNPGIKCGEKHIDYQKRIGKNKFRPIKDSIKCLYGALIFFQSVKKERFLTDISMQRNSRC